MPVQSRHEVTAAAERVEEGLLHRRPTTLSFGFWGTRLELNQHPSGGIQKAANYLNPRNRALYPLSYVSIQFTRQLSLVPMRHCGNGIVRNRESPRKQISTLFLT